MFYFDNIYIVINENIYYNSMIQKKSRDDSKTHWYLGKYTIVSDSEILNDLNFRVLNKWIIQSLRIESPIFVLLKILLKRFFSEDFFRINSKAIAWKSAKSLSLRQNKYSYNFPHFQILHKLNIRRKKLFTLYLNRKKSVKMAINHDEFSVIYKFKYSCTCR